MVVLPRIKIIVLVVALCFVFGVFVPKASFTAYAACSPSPTSGNDTITCDNDNDVIDPEQGNDVVNAGGGGDVVQYSEGRDTLDGGSGSDTYDGQAAPHDLEVDLRWNDHAKDRQFTNPNHDPNLDSIPNVEHAITGSGNDYVVGDAAGNYIETGSGNDAVQGYEGNDTIYGGAGDDWLGGNFGGPSDPNERNIIHGESGNDTIYGADGSDTIDGGSEADEITDALGDDSVFGNTGNDTFLVGNGNDTLDGGDDIDVHDTSAYANSVLVDLGAGASSGTDIGNNILSNIENATSGSGNDTLMGSAENNALIGNGGNDSLNGLGGNDTLSGGTGNDTLTGGAGNDLLDGGANTDLYIASSDSDVVNLGDGTTSGVGVGSDTLSNIEQVQTLGGDDTVIGSAADERLDGGSDTDTYDASASTNGVIIDFLNSQATGTDIGSDTILNFENAIGGAGDDQFFGGGNANSFIGNVGNDSLSGGGGNDTLSGGNDDDTIIGGADNDLLLGDAGADILDGETGDDTLLGGAGDDTLTTSTGIDSLDGGADNDVIHVLGTHVAGDYITGGTGTNIFTFQSGTSGQLIVESQENDTLDFRLFGNAITLDLSQTNTLQNVGGGLFLELRGLFENVLGTVFIHLTVRKRVAHGEWKRGYQRVQALAAVQNQGWK